VIQIGKAPAFLSLAQPLQLLVDGDDVSRFRRVDQAGDRAEYPPVLIAIEVRVEEQVTYSVPCRVVEEQATENAGLRLNRIWRDTQAGAIYGGWRVAH
jgi:hypothetical protein